MKKQTIWNEFGVDTISIHAGQPADVQSGAVMTPVVLSSTFAQKRPGEHLGFDYSRSGNPTRKALEECLAALEGATHGFAFASGCSAMVTLLHTLRPGDHIICGDDVYGGTFRILDKVMKPMGISNTLIDMQDISNVHSAILPNTKLIWMESPTNPLLKIFDIEAIAKIASKSNLQLIVDNTFASPVLQQPLQLGATAVVHSLTKYLNGHSDVVGGALMTSDSDFAEKVKFLQNAIGAIPSPFDCYMTLRGIKTLGVRVRSQSASAMVIAERLEKHSSVKKVHYPGLPSHSGFHVAKKQMKLPGGMISFVLKGGLLSATKFLTQLNIFSCAESLGGVESLAEHPALMTHASIPPEHRQAIGIDDGLVRLSIGIENTEDLWKDIEQALLASEPV